MEKTVFNMFRNLVYEKSGIALNDGKEALVSARIGKRMIALGITSHRDYLRYVRADESSGEIIHLIDAISTNVTSFFRESEHFDFLAKTIVEWANQGQREFRLWSAACSSGEEPYSLAMTVTEKLNGKCDSVRILATDISTRILDKARSGRYDAEKIKNIPQNQRKMYFDLHQYENTLTYEAKDILKDKVVFCR